MSEGTDGLAEDAQQWMIHHAQRRHEHQADLMTAQEARAANVLATATSLSALAALAAAIALAVPRDTRSVLVASLVALAGFSAAAILMITSVRSRRFRTPGGRPSEIQDGCDGSVTLQALRTAWLAELEERLDENALLLEERRRLVNWALWTLISTPVFALACGWIAAS